MRVDLEDLMAQLDISNKGKVSAENMNKQLEASISKMTVKMNDYTRQITDLNNVKGKIAAELGDAQRALEASEANFQQVSVVENRSHPRAADGNNNNDIHNNDIHNNNNNNKNNNNNQNNNNNNNWQM